MWCVVTVEVDAGESVGGRTWLDCWAEGRGLYRFEPSELVRCLDRRTRTRRQDADRRVVNAAVGK